ncbi:MAG: methyltransferase [Marinobacter sp.]
MTPRPDWVRRHPELVRWLEQLDERQCDHYEDHPRQLAARVGEWLPELAAYEALVAVPDLSPGPGAVNQATLTEREATDMPGRKRLQAGALCAALLPLHHPALDWCCGKGHLARTLARRGDLPVTGYEWNPELVADGNRLAQRYGDPVRLHRQDVMDSALAWPGRMHGTALHACGDLHRKLVRDGVNHGQPRLSFSPCCYHLGRGPDYRPLSARAGNDPHCLSLVMNDLRLAVQETVTAPARVREQTAMASQWRLGFDGLQRHLRQQDTYLPLPPHPTRLMQEGFEAFCRWAAQRKGLALPEAVDWQHWQAHGVRRFREVRRHELIRHLFRRPLELWLVLDYALFLEEAGYQVRVGTFCERSLTPRNLLVDAVRGG